MDSIAKSESTSKREAADLGETAKLFRARLDSRSGFLWVVSTEELRVERLVARAAEKSGYAVVLWDCASGATDIDGEPIGSGGMKHPLEVVEAIQRREQRSRLVDEDKPDGGQECREVWICRDLDPWLDDFSIQRAYKSLARSLQGEREPNRFAAVVVLTANPTVPDPLRQMTTVIDWPLPNRKEVEEIVGVASRMGKRQGCEVPQDEEARQRIVNAALGLSADDVSGALTFSMVTRREIHPDEILRQKRAIIDRTPTLQWLDPEPRGLDAIGGLDRLKRRFERMSRRLEPESQEFGLPALRGLLLAGISGCAKSFSARCAASALGLPLVRLDLGAQRGSLVGETEKNMRSSFRTIEALAPVIVQIEEIEKALGHVRGTLDGGTGSGQLASLLTFMQEHRGQVIFLASCNSVSNLPPELFRRFDDTYFVDLPTAVERGEILRVGLRKHGGRDESALDCSAIVEATAGFTGAEIADKMIPAALEEAYVDGRREPVTKDFVTAAEGIIPLSTSSKEDIDALRGWARRRALMASSPEERPVAVPKRRSKTEAQDEGRFRLEN